MLERGRSAEDAVNRALDITAAAFKKKRTVIWLAFDFRSAFDHAWWPHILSCLRKYRLPNNLYCLIKDYLKNRKAMFIHNGKKLAEVELEKSCPQGAVLGPLLWNIVIDNF